MVCSALSALLPIISYFACLVLWYALFRYPLDDYHEYTKKHRTFQSSAFKNCLVKEAVSLQGFQVAVHGVWPSWQRLEAVLFQLALVQTGVERPYSLGEAVFFRGNRSYLGLVAISPC